MTVSLLISNKYVTIENADLKTIRKIDSICAYKVAGYFFSPAYKAHWWDGREHLFRFTKKLGYHAPTGLVEDIIDCLKDRGVDYSIKFSTRLKHKKIKLGWNPEISLRGYQEEAVSAILGKPLPGRGIIKIPPRGGKTVVASKIIQTIGRPCLFVVPSKGLLYQSINRIKEYIPDAEVGQIGDSIYDPKFITVSTIQTLSLMAPLRKTKKREGRSAHPEYYKLMSMFDVGIYDEVHHFNGEGDWNRVTVDLDARFKIGMSATIFFDNTKEQESGIIWTCGTCGRIKCDIPISRLVREGYLLRQHIKIYYINKPLESGSKYSATLKKRCITENKYRNKKIAEIAKKYNAKKTIIIAHEHIHINNICEELKKRNLAHKTLTGLDKQSVRDKVVKEFISGKFNIIVGNVLGEGIDIPAIEVVINAEGGKDEKQTWQRQRNLTILEGSDKSPIMIDFFDKTSPYFEKHSRARLSVYNSEDEFDVEVIK